MSRRDPKYPLCTVLAASMLLGVVPACSASGFRLHRGQVAEPDASGNIVYRPVYPPGLPQARTMYPGGYAGIVYPPLGFRRPLNATGYAAQPDGTVSRPHKWGWWRH
jgi:hypothetical protein